MNAFIICNTSLGLNLFVFLQMRTVNPDGALKMYAQAGQWDKCLELAEKQVEREREREEHYS